MCAGRSWSLDLPGQRRLAKAEFAMVPITPGPTTRSLDLGEVPEGKPPAAAYLDGQPGISGRMGEADAAQTTRDGPCHGRLGFWPGLGPYFAAVMRTMACAVRYARLVLVAPFLEEPLTHFRLAT